MDFFSKMKGNLQSTTDGLKFQMQIKENEKKIEGFLYQVGVACYNQHREEYDTEYEAFFKEIRVLQEENRKIQLQIQGMNAPKTCQQCGAENNKEAKFCVGCGSPLGMQNPVVASQSLGSKVCGSCNHANKEGCLFCVNCGSKL